MNDLEPGTAGEAGLEDSQSCCKSVSAALLALGCFSAAVSVWILALSADTLLSSTSPSLSAS